MGGREGVKRYKGWREGSKEIREEQKQKGGREGKKGTSRNLEGVKKEDVERMWKFSRESLIPVLLERSAGGEACKTV